jgi:transposase
MYAADQHVMKGGHTVARMPPYHCNLNAIESTWSQLKGYVTRQKQKLQNLRDTPAELGEVTAERWQDTIHHVIQEEQRMWKLDGLTDNVVGSSL